MPDATLMNLDNLKISRDLLLQFFLVFSRFEYALKNSGFVQAGRSRQTAPSAPSAEPNWNAFAHSIANLFTKGHNTDLNQACEYFLINPPMRQVLINGNVMWDTTEPDLSLGETERLLLLVRRVRNNLFHGGKFSNEAFEDTDRQERLLKGSLLVLKECLRVSPQVNNAFDSAII